MGLKIKSEKVVKEVEVEGSFGTYIAKTGEGVALRSKGAELHLGAMSDLELLKSEFKEVFNMVEV